MSLGWILITETKGSTWTLLGMPVLGEAEVEHGCFLLMPSLHLSGLLEYLLPKKEQVIRHCQSTKLNFNILMQDLLWFFYLYALLLEGSGAPHPEMACGILVSWPGFQYGPQQ